MGELVYLYGIVPDEEAGQKALPAFKGLDGEHDLCSVSINNMAALICHLDEDDYSEVSIKEKMNNDLEWLQEKAFHHHEILMALNERYTVIPMKFCIIFSCEQNLRETVEKNQATLTQAFTVIKGNEEWNLKIYCDDPELKKHVGAHNADIEARKKEISRLSPGRQYFEKRKIEKMLDVSLEREKNRVCEEIHDRLTGLSLHHEVKRNWNKDVTGRNEEMSWNSVYLVPNAEIDRFLKEIKHLKDQYASSWTFEVTGPWPAYHFASLTGT